MNVLDNTAATAQRGVLLVSTVSSRYLSSQPAFRLNAKPTWAEGEALATACFVPPSLRHEDTQYLPRTNL